MLWVSSVNSFVHLPKIWAVLVLVLTAACWFALLNNLVGMPRFECFYASGELCLYRSRTQEPWRRLARSDIDRFAIERQMYYPDECPPVQNYVVTVFTFDGKKFPLCASPDESLIDAISVALSEVRDKSQLLPMARSPQDIAI
jgi:hypothetical protein